MTADSEARDEVARPVILFDGVCNLCNAAVRWVVDRDVDGRFDFASLQSEAARHRLAGAAPPTGIGELPDSIVLLAGDGTVHTRSSAAIGIARGLGFPWSLFTATRVVPRPLRDAVYGFIARNRYRWFGRRDTCSIPAPDVAARFLDADEPRPVIPLGKPGDGDSGRGGDSDEGQDGSREEESDRGGNNGGRDPTATDAVGGDVQRRSLTTVWLTRFVIVYVLVYIVPTGSILGPLVTWVGQTLFGVEATPVFTGSGDTTFNYLDLLVKTLLAVVLSITWVSATRGRPVSARTFDFSRFATRYYLGFTLLTYGWAKVFPLQFTLPGPDRLIQPYGDSSPMGLAWTFFGASVGYQMFAGLSELLGGYLLFWRRTTLVGSMIAATVMTNVMAVNYFFDVPVKLFSTHLFLVAVFLMAPDLPRLVGLFGFNLPVQPRAAAPFWRRKRRGPAGGRWRAPAVMLVHALVVGALTVLQVRGGLEASRARGILSEPSPLTGIYRVEAFEQAGLVDREVEDRARWVRVGLNLPFVATVQRASGDAVRMRIELDEEAGTLSFFDRGATAPEEPTFSYSESAPGVLRLDGVFEEKSTVIVLRKDEAGALLVERGFRWINEFPFNR